MGGLSGWFWVFWPGALWDMRWQLLFCSVFACADWAACLVEGGGRESPGMRGTFLCFAKEKCQNDPLSASPALRYGATCGARGRCALRNSLLTRSAQTAAAGQSTKRVCPGGTRATRAPRRIQRAGEQVHPHGPLLRCLGPPCAAGASARAARAERSDGPNGCPAVRMFGCPPLLAAPAAGGCGVSMGVAAPMPRELTRRGCPSGAQRKSQFHAPRNRHDGLPLRSAKGSQTGVAFGTFLWRAKQVPRRRATTRLGTRDACQTRPKLFNTLSPKRRKSATRRRHSRPRNAHATAAPTPQT